MDINRAVQEYQNFYNDYNKGEMFKIRNIMRQLSRELLNSLQDKDNTNDMTAMQVNEYNTYMNKKNDEYNMNKEIYKKMVNAYFPYTMLTLPKMMPMLHDDQFNYFDPATYHDVLETYNKMITGETSYETTTQKVNDKVKKAFNV